MKLKSLNCNFLTDADLLNLNLVSIQTTDQFISYADFDSLSKLTKIPLKNLKLIKKFIIGQYSPFPEQGDILLGQFVSKFFRIETGSNQIDHLISYGIFSNEITEITGSTATGKTEFCFNLVANMFAKNPNFSCVFIYSNNCFCPIRLRKLFLAKLKTSKFSNQSQEVLDKALNKIFDSIRVINCTNAFHLLDILFEYKKTTTSSMTQAKDENKIPNLVIIDSLSDLFTLFKPGYSHEAVFCLNNISNQLKYLTANMNMAIVVVTNSSESSNRMNNLFNYPSWTSVPSLIACLKSECIECEESGERIQTRTFEILKLNRPNFSELLKSKNSCIFTINDFGIA